jgi:3-dehydrosphinganine reductase
LKNASESARVLEEAKTWNNNQAPDIVWCVAGSAYPEFFLNMTTEILQDGMNQNYWSAAYMAHATLKEWLRPTEPSSKQQSNDSMSFAPRHIIFTSSVAAFSPLVGYAGYAPAKAALRALSDSLSQELKLYSGARRHVSHPGPPFDVKIHTVFPATIYTPGFAEEQLIKPGVTKKIEEMDSGQTEDEVAATSIRGLQRGEYLTTTTFLGALTRGGMWGGSPRNNVVLDTLMSWLASIAWLFVQPSVDATVTKWGEEHGHPATYQRGTPSQ